jgi:hypothetical protein
MSRWLALADGGAVNTHSPPDTPTKPDKTPLPPEIGELRHGFAVNGHPKTWTGKIVSLDAWRQLDAWERHGPNGRMWCGVCRDWQRDCEHIKKAKEDCGL